MMKYSIKLNPFTDHVTDFELLVASLVSRTLPIEEKIEEVDKLINYYCESIGERPRGKALYKLSNYLLKDDIVDRSPYKMTKSLYPILTKGQEKRRYRRERNFDPTILERIEPRCCRQRKKD